MAIRLKNNLRSITRESLFGDVPIEHWPAADQPADAEPWKSFLKARELFVNDHFQKAVQTLQGILAMPGLESRHYLETWHFLREAEIQPDAAIARQVHGVVVETPLPRGIDVVAAYADHTVCHLEPDSTTVIRDTTDATLNGAIDALLQAGQKAVAEIGPWQSENLPPPPPGQARASILTPSGIHFGQAPLKDLEADEQLGPLVAAGASLTKALSAKIEKEKPG